MEKATAFRIISMLITASLLLTSCGGLSGPAGSNIKKPLTAAIGNKPVVVGNIDKNGIEISIPAGVLTEENTFSLKLSESSPQNDPAVGSLLGTPVEIDIDGDIKRFDEPVEVAFKLTDEQWSSFENPRDIHIGYYDGYNWVYLDPTHIDTENKIVTFTTYHCSYIYPSKAEKEEMKRQIAKNLAVESTTIDKNAELRKTTESMVKSVMGPTVDKSLLRDIVEGIMDQNDFTQLGKAVANQNGKETEGQFISVYTQVVANTLWAYAKNADDLGDLGANLGLVGSFGTSASHFANGDYQAVAEELARGIISTHPVGKLLTTAVNVTERQIARWKSEEIEAAYQIYLNGKEPTIPFWGYGSIEEGDFNEIWNQMRGVGRQIVIDAVNDFKAENGREPTDEERETLEQDAKVTLEREFKERKNKEAVVAEAEKKNLEFLKIMEDGNLLTSNRYGYDTDKISYKDRVRQILELRNKVIADTNRKMNFGGEDSKTEINVYTVEKLISEHLSNGEESYNEMLIQLGLVEVLDSGSIAGSYTTPLNFSKTTLSKNETLNEGKLKIRGSASIGSTDAAIEILSDGMMRISYSASISTTQENTVEYNPEYTAVDTETANYVVMESFKDMKINTRPGAATQFSDIIGDRTYSGHETRPQGSWDVNSDQLTGRLESVTAKIIGTRLVITGKTVIDMPDTNVGNIFEGFPATFELSIDTAQK